VRTRSAKLYPLT